MKCLEKEYNPALQFDAFTAGIEDGGLRSSSSIAILACYIIARSEERLTKKNVVDALVEGKIANYFELGNRKIIKKDQVSSKIYDSILVFIVSYTLMGIGSVLWLLGVIAVVNALRNILYISLSRVIYSILLGIVCNFFGSLTVVSGKKFEDELDSNRIYAFSASIFALISCIAGILAILK